MQSLCEMYNKCIDEGEGEVYCLSRQPRPLGNEDEPPVKNDPFIFTFSSDPFQTPLATRLLSLQSNRRIVGPKNTWMLQSGGSSTTQQPSKRILPRIDHVLADDRVGRRAVSPSAAEGDAVSDAADETTPLLPPHPERRRNQSEPQRAQNFIRHSPEALERRTTSSNPTISAKASTDQGQPVTCRPEPGKGIESPRENDATGLHDPPPSRPRSSGIEIGADRTAGEAEGGMDRNASRGEQHRWRKTTAALGDVSDWAAGCFGCRRRRARA